MTGPAQHIKGGVQSLQNSQQSIAVKQGGGVAGGRGNNTSLKSPNRKPTPANPHHVTHNRPTEELANKHTLNPAIEVDEVDSEEDSLMTLSPAAQAHSLSLFLSSSTSDSGTTVHTMS